MVSSARLHSGVPGAIAWLSHRRAGSGSPVVAAGSKVSATAVVAVMAQNTGPATTG